MYFFVFKFGDSIGPLLSIAFHDYTSWVWQIQILELKSCFSNIIKITFILLKFSFIRSIKILFAKRNFLDKKFLLQDTCIFPGLCIPNLPVPSQISLFLQDLPLVKQKIFLGEPLVRNQSCNCCCFRQIALYLTIR